MGESTNLELARRAWSFMNTPSTERASSGGGDSALFDLLADDVKWSHEGPRDPRIPTYPGEVHGKRKLVEMIAWEEDVVEELDLEDPIRKPMRFVASGDRVVLFHEERYRIKRSGVTVRHNHAAVVMDFEDGLITRMRVIANLSDYIEAHLGRGWTGRLYER